MSKRLNRLPHELAEIEARLAKLPLPASSINRDEMLYRAGWAAAEVKSSNKQRGNGSHWLWPATSAALAATVMLLLFPPWAETKKNTQAPDFAGSSAEEKNSKQIAVIQVDESDLSRERQPRWPRENSGFRSRLPRNAATWQLSWLGWEDSLRSPVSRMARRHRPWLQQFNTRPLEMAIDDTPTPPSKTSRELLQELLPELEQSTENDDRQNENHWYWPKQLWETLS